MADWNNVPSCGLGSSSFGNAEALVWQKDPSSSDFLGFGDISSQPYGTQLYFWGNYVGANWPQENSEALGTVSLGPIDKPYGNLIGFPIANRLQACQLSAIAWGFERGAGASGVSSFSVTISDYYTANGLSAPYVQTFDPSILASGPLGGGINWMTSPGAVSPPGILPGSPFSYTLTSDVPVTFRIIDTGYTSGTGATPGPFVRCPAITGPNGGSDKTCVSGSGESFGRSTVCVTKSVQWTHTFQLPASGTFELKVDTRLDGVASGLDNSVILSPLTVTVG